MQSTAWHLWSHLVHTSVRDSRDSSQSGYFWSIRDEDPAKSRCSPLYSGQTSKPYSSNKVGSVFQDLQSDFKLESLCSTALERLEELSKSLEIPSCHFWDVETECLGDAVQCSVKFLRFVAEEDV